MSTKPEEWEEDKQFRSKCCAAPFHVNQIRSGQLEEGATRYYICDKCDKPCDVLFAN